MERHFVQANSSNLPKVDALMIVLFFKDNIDLYAAELKNVKTAPFPSANEPWKKDWIQIIREWRNEKDWNPSKSSVICSTHFDANDLYTTKSGLIRVVTYGVPKKVTKMDVKMEIKEEVDNIGDEYNKYSERLVLEDNMSQDGNSQCDKILDVSEYICSMSSGGVLLESKEHIPSMKGHIQPGDDSTMKVASTPLRLYQRQSRTRLIEEVDMLDAGPKKRKLSSAVLERVEAIDLQKEAVPRHLKLCLGQAYSVAGPRSSSNAAGANILNASGKVSGSLVDSANTTRSVGNLVVADANVLPSTSRVTRTSWPTAKRACNEFDSDYDDDELDEIAPGRGVLSSRNIPDDEELDEPVRDIIDAVERAMDDEADALGVSSSFDWVAGFDSFRGVPETFTGPTPGPVKDYDTPYDAFIDIWDENIIEHIVDETNRNVHQTIGSQTAKGKLFCPSSPLLQWKHTTADEILALFAIYICMGIDRRTSQEEYWKTNTCLEMSAFRKIIPYHRYCLLSNFIHFADKLDTSNRHLQYGGITLPPKFAPIAPLISHLDTKFSSLYNLKREVTVDESLTLFKGRLSWAETTRSNAAHSGIKSYELCESESGYLYRFQILYTGKNSDNVGSGDVADLGGKSNKVVLDLLEGLEHRGHCVTMDNFYNSPSLARYLKTKGFDCLGTLRVNRRHVPDDIAKVPNNVAKGTIIARHSGDVSILSWKYFRVVTMISTYHNDKTCVESKTGRPLVKPISVRDYNNTMAGVDLKDKQIAMYFLEQKNVKWYIKMFRRLLDISIHNAFIMFKKSSERRNRPVLTHCEFRYKLADDLVYRHRCDRVVNRLDVPPVTDVLRLRRDILHCPVIFPDYKYRKRCVVCKTLKSKQKQKKIILKCDICDVVLCFGECWVTYHSQLELGRTT